MHQPGSTTSAPTFGIAITGAEGWDVVEPRVRSLDAEPQVTNLWVFDERFERVVSLFPLLADRKKERAGLLSGGERQMVAMGRALAETAALIFTSGYVDRMPESLHDSGRALSVHIYDLSLNVSGGEASAAASALVLVALLVLLNGLARRSLSALPGSPA